jgi:lipoprotein NlpD
MNVSIGNAVAVHHHRPTHSAFGRLALAAVLASLLVTAGCSTRRLSQPAPVEDRTGVIAPAVVLLPGAENAGKPGYFTVRPGDTLYRIALEAGQSPRDLQAWNKLTNPNLIEVGQVLRVVPPAVVATASASAPAATAPAATGVTTTPVAPGAVTSRPLDSTAAATPVPAPAPASAGADNVTFLWPSQGEVIANFDEAKNKGISIAGRIGDPVVAAADGRVVYAGAGLRGYGNLIILKHNNTFLTAYAHNQALLVREDQAVRQGQKIAEMGSSDADRVKLHFEVRRQGKPVDPLGFLPKR